MPGQTACGFDEHRKLYNVGGDRGALTRGDNQQDMRYCWDGSPRSNDVRRPCAVFGADAHHGTPALQRSARSMLRQLSGASSREPSPDQMIIEMCAPICSVRCFWVARSLRAPCTKSGRHCAEPLALPRTLSVRNSLTPSGTTLM